MNECIKYLLEYLLRLVSVWPFMIFLSLCVIRNKLEECNNVKKGGNHENV